MDLDIALEALNALCCAGVAAAQGQAELAVDIVEGAARLKLSREELSIRDLVHLVLLGRLSSVHGVPGSFPEPIVFISPSDDVSKDNKTGEIEISSDPKWSKEHLDPGFNYDFTNLKDTEKYSRGGEEYKRPYGWKRFALKVLGEYEDNTWLGNNRRSTESVPGEWPVSYHGTSEGSVKPIIDGNYEPGKRQVYGRGVYSTPDVKEAERYATKFKSKKTGQWFKAVLQNRINPKHRKKCDRPKGLPEYWLVEITAGTSKEKEHEIVEKAIRPYGLLLKEI